MWRNVNFVLKWGIVMKLASIPLLIAIIISSSACGASLSSGEDYQGTTRGGRSEIPAQTLHAADLADLFSAPEVRALARAAARGDVKAVQEMAASSVDVNSRGQGGVIPLYWPLKHDSFTGFKALLEAGADPNIVFWDTSVIHLAARKSDLRYLEELLQADANPNLRAGDFSKTPIFDVIGINQPSAFEAMDILIREGADIEARTEGTMFGQRIGGKTPLLYAADQGRFDIVCSLLAEGANPAAEDVDGYDLQYRLNELKDRVEPGSQLQADLRCVRDRIRD